MSLKMLCSQLARKPSSLDVMLLFDRPTTILQPICEVLDSWRYDEDQGEYQPVYEEFGSILLLVLSFTHRYGLATLDLGIRTPDSFVAKLLNQGHLSRAMDDLTPQESNHLDGWIRGLFDNESGGLGDELMSSCPPQDFYLLIPTLFHHIVLAFQTKNLSDEALKGGLEFLVDTFLLPSLIPGITWLAAHLWESRGDASAVIVILSALITSPTSISNNPEASQMLNSILNIIAKPLEHSLRWLQHAEPSRQDIEPLSRSLRQNLGWERRAASEHTELEDWTQGGLGGTLKNKIQELMHWGLNPAGNNPTPYTHRLLLVSVKILGARRVLSIIIEEVKSQSEQGHGSVILDIATALICAPESSSWDPLDSQNAMNTLPAPTLQKRLTLREQLKFEVQEVGKIHKEDAFHAENLVRLARKVESQSVLPMRAGEAAMNAVLGEALDAVGAGGGLDVDGVMAGVVGGMDMGEGMGIGLGDGSGAGGGNGIGGAGIGGGNGTAGMDVGAMADDLMSGLMSSHQEDLLDGFGSGLGDGMGF
jgi:mediator of RNA polymerase II transcription subunit 5